MGKLSLDMCMKSCIPFLGILMFCIWKVGASSNGFKVLTTKSSLCVGVQKCMSCHYQQKTPPPWLLIQLEFFLLVHARYVGYSSFATISCSPCGNALITHFVSLYIWEGKQQSLQPQGVGNPSCKSGLPIGVSTKSICY
jgi:hypothetical protein